MNKAIILFFCFLLGSIKFYGQNQEIDGSLTITSTTSIGKDIPNKFGEGTRLYLKGIDNSGYDDVWLAKYVEKSDNTSLRISVGDDFSDRIEFGISHWQAGKWYNQFTFLMNGNMGIGVSHPSYPLEVNGTIRAKEVKIESTGWADFVFKPEYKLPTLSEVENHILEYGYLPNIPSESKANKEGVNVGEMQVKLLQKIEELTLYVIDLKKESEKQYSIIQQQQKEIEILKTTTK